MFGIRYEELTQAELAKLRPYERKRVFDEVDEQLSVEPATPSRRKKKLTGVIPPWEQVRPVWQLRVGDLRVLYDVDEEARAVIINAIRRKGSKTTKEIL
jgi:mRNA-degrading endonuclease RelE of RelBE toxin-antitoxin system